MADSGTRMNVFPRSKSILLVLLMGCLWVRAVGGQSSKPPDIFSVRISIHDRESHAPLRMASIRISGSPQSYTSDTTGHLSIEARQGTIRFHARALGYSPLDTVITVESDTVIRIALARAVQLDTVRATASATREHLREFEARRQLGSGRYLTESDLVVEGNRPFASVAAARFPVRTPGGHRVLHGRDGASAVPHRWKRMRRDLGLDQTLKGRS